MTVKEYLKRTRKEQAELKYLTELREEKWYTLLPKGITYDRDKVQVSPIDMLSETAAEINLLDRKIAEIAARLEAHKETAIGMINTLEDSTERLVLMMYYLTYVTDDNGVVKKTTWEDVARKIDYSISTVYWIHDKAIEHLNQKYKSL